MYNQFGGVGKHICISRVGASICNICNNVHTLPLHKGGNMQFLLSNETFVDFVVGFVDKYVFFLV